jgi:hypothetical protein
MLFGEELIAQGLIKKEQLEESLKIQKQFPEKKLGEIMIEMKYINIDQMISVAKKQLNDAGIP